MAADLAVTVATPFIEYLTRRVGRQFGYILFYRRYLKELKEGVDTLKAELEGVEHKCEAAKRNAMEIEKKVTKWIDDVNGAVKEADKLLLVAANTVDDGCRSWFKRCVCLDHHPPVTLLSQRAEQIADTLPQDVDLRVRKRLFYLNPVVRYKKGRKAKKTMQVVQRLNEDKKNLGDISYEDTIVPPILSAKDYESLGSRSAIVKDIIKVLSDPKVSAIGVWGMGGVGKSTLMKEVMRLAREKNLFDDVAMVVVSQNPDIKKIQGELAVWLGLNFKDDENVTRRASRLHKRLKPIDEKRSAAKENHDEEPVVEGKLDMKQKQVLIILDDIWERLDLKEIGIPSDAVKLLFTSRKQNVLSSEMDCSENVFELKVLEDVESWRLFESIVGEKLVGPDSKFRPIGKQLVQKCSGLPLLLNAIATTLRNCSLAEWKDALVEFEGSNDAYSCLEISYKHLESDEVKSLFLVCALTNHAYISVQDLLYYSMGLGLLKGKNTVRSARDKLKAMLHILQDSSLLLKDGIQDHVVVHIHDVVREVAISIAYRDQDSPLITDEFEMKEFPREKLKKSKAISIPYPHVNFRRLPEGWVCPELRTFLLYRRLSDPPIDISDSFFEGMKELSVLDFTGRICDSLPSSIQFLLNLNTLRLDQCSIEDLTIVGKLKQLQILTFIGSEIARLPKEIGELSELKVLNLKNSKLAIIEPQVLGRLTSLEELCLKGSSYRGWEDEGEMQPSNAKVSELNSLSHLNIVDIHIHNPSTIPRHLEFGNVAEYIIQIGDVWDWSGDYKESRMLKIKLESCRGSFLHEKWVQDLLKRTQNLHLDGTKGWQRSIHELCLDGFPELKHLHLQNNSSVQCVSPSIPKWSPACTTFTVLELLFLEKLTGLETISRGPIAPDSFSKLKVIKVIDCGKLKSLFSYSMLKCVSLLEEIEVRDCEAIQVIVTVDSVVTNTDQVVKLEALHRIELHNLPNFMTFCGSQKVEPDQTKIMPISSEIVQEDPCIPTNTMFPNNQLVSFPILKSLILTSLPKLKYIWQKTSSVEVAKLENLQVSSCEDLLIVIPSSLVKEVKNLETLEVTDCESVQEVFETGDDDVALNFTSNDVEILSRLNNHHQTEKVNVFHNLNSLKVVNCNSPKNLLPGTLLKSLNQLRKIRIEKCKEIETFVTSVNDNIVFQSLADVWLEDLPNMVTFVWTKGGESINFPALKELYVKECPKMTSFSLLKEDASAQAEQLCFFDDKVLLPLLARLDLISMESVQKIWHEEIIGQSFCSLEIPSIKMTAVQFGNLKEIVIRECISFEGSVFKFTVAEETTGKEYYSLPLLEKLYLSDLPKLKHVVQPDSHVVVGFPSLVEIDVGDCECVIDVFPIATAATLYKLEDLKVLRCRSMRRIFGKDEEAADDDEMLASLLFPRLRSIIVQNLDSLISVFSGINCVLGFPSLEALYIGCCSKLKTFVQSNHTSDETLERKEGVHYYLFDDKVEMPNLKTVGLLDLNTLQTVWKTNLPCLNICDRIGQITEILIMNCENLEEIIFECDNGEKEIKTTNDDPAVFHSLANVTLGNLPNMVAFIRGRRDQSINFPSLKELYVDSCQKMRAFYLPNTEESGGGSGGESSLPLCLLDHKVEFPNLQKIIVAECKGLQHIFTASFASNLAQLEELCINNCVALEEIVMHGDIIDYGSSEELDGRSSSQMFFFPQLTSLELYELPNLRSFFRGSNASTWSALKTLWMWHCDKVQIFTRKFSSSNSENSSTRLSLFSAEQVIPKLEILRLVEEDFIMIRGFKEDIFTELKHFSLACFHNVGAAAFPSRFLLDNNFPKLERLNVFCSSFEEIFADESLSPQELISYKERLAIAGEVNEKPLARLREVKLSELHNLKHVWKADMTVFAEILKSIQVLELWGCPKLKNLFPTASCCFGNITTIKVYDCNGMQELVTTSAATSLVKLTHLDIYDCGMIETIVSADGSKTAENDGELVITFRELKHIGLHRLPSLTSFSSANCKFELPSLEEVIVIECPNLMVFSNSSVVAPKLSKVLLTEEEEEEEEETGKVRWDGDLNTTIQNLPK